MGIGIVTTKYGKVEGVALEGKYEDNDAAAAVPGWASQAHGTRG